MEKYKLQYTGNEVDNLLEKAEKSASQEYVNQAINAASFITGMILMWSGSIDAVPTGWALCNGNNGTPNLVDRFIVGAGNQYAIGNIGGSDTVTLTTAQMPSHTHTGSTAKAGSHTHTIRVGEYSYESVLKITAPTGKDEHRNKDVPTNSAGEHTHTLTINSAGSGESHENRPPYYALAYIMKL